MERQEGFYWVKMSDVWEVALFTGEYWLIPGSLVDWYDSDFDTINEVRIVNNII